MSNKTLLKAVAAFGMLAAILLILAVQFVPNIFADTPAEVSNLNVASLSGSDWIERHPAVVARAASYTGSDWIERNPSNYYTGSDWIERHPGQPTQ
jgi:hypothetical protein